MNKEKLLDLLRHACVLEAVPQVWRKGPVSLQEDALLMLIERNAVPLRAALEAQLQALPPEPVAGVKCDRCTQWHTFDRVRLLPEAVPWRGPEAVCVPCLEDHHREELARARDVIGECDDCRRERDMEALAQADGAHEGRSIDDACERTAGRED